MSRDRRRQERHRIMAPAMVHSGEQSGEGILHDVSATGAGVGVGFHVPLGASVTIAVEGLGELPGRVVRRGNRLGIALDPEIAEAAPISEGIVQLVEESAPRKLVMLVEDSLTQAITLQAALENQGFKVVRLPTAEDALTLLESSRPDLLIIDYHLPSVQGDELCRRVRMNLNTQSIPILMLTSDTGPAAELKSLESGADDYVSKEEDAEILLLRIRALLRKAQVEDPFIDLDDPRFYRPRILLIDDSPTSLEQIRDILGPEEFHVETATNGMEGLQAAENGDYDCLLVDMVMPDLNGEEVVARLAEAGSHSDTPYVIIALSAHEERDTLARALEAGANDFVGKSVDAAILKARVRANLRQKFLHDQRRKIIAELRRHKDHLENAVEERTWVLRQEIAEREEIEKQLRRSQEAAEAANQAKSQFIANMSHELRTPLTAIIGFSEAIKTQLGGAGRGFDPETYGDYIDHIFTSGHHLLRIINDVLDISRIEGGKLEIEEEAIDLRDLLETAWRFVAQRAGEKRIGFEDRLPETPPGVHGDRRLLSQTFLNLFSNAVKFTPEDGRITVEATAAAEGGLDIAVADTGIGISAADLEKILEPFGQVESGYQRNYEGSGLGLPIAKSFIERHGGSLSITSQPDRGTTVTVHLPAHRVAPAAE